MAVQYTYSKYKDVHTIVNSEPTNNISYIIKKNDCGVLTTMQTGEIIPSKTITLNFKLDGNYVVELENGPDTATVNIAFFNNILTSFIVDCEKILCGCGDCKECEQCGSCEDFINAYTKGFSFNALNAALYQAEVTTRTNYSLCVYTNTILCAMKNNLIYGNTSFRPTMEQLLAIYYLAFHDVDYTAAIDDAEKTYVDTKYNYVKLRACLKSMGIIFLGPLE
jgi:hypothetical protein